MQKLEWTKTPTGFKLALPYKDFYMVPGRPTPEGTATWTVFANTFECYGTAISLDGLPPFLLATEVVVRGLQNKQTKILESLNLMANIPTKLSE